MSMTMDMPGMSTSTPSADTSGMDMMMTPWLHFVGGDNLFFKTLNPSSHGAIAGACIVLGFLAIFERWFASVRGVLEVHWYHSAHNQVKSKVADEGDRLSTSPTPDKEHDVVKGDVDSLKGASSARVYPSRGSRVSRLSPPFILSHDIPRGVGFAFQAFLAYILMLAVMTFQAAYIIAIIVGLGIGEFLFGRLGSARGHILH
ncbi:hypothetical protein NM688_g4154 [Phlebia brevispora]|uniref:Uncharacterized protein n=1 Tax=Phlebia brevispora TaxID=194682 RepID=A0ACC1T3P9_9APHY|nr:hypothetical protein NM688_g4154 [Phlebia brevispora]